MTFMIQRVDSWQYWRHDQQRWVSDIGRATQYRLFDTAQLVARSLAPVKTRIDTLC